VLILLRTIILKRGADLRFSTNSEPSTFLRACEEFRVSSKRDSSEV
jgi:hypothetical protein